MGKLVEALKGETSITGKDQQTCEGTEQNHPRSKNGCRNNKEIIQGNNSGDSNSRKEIRCKHQQQNTWALSQKFRCKMP